MNYIKELKRDGQGGFIQRMVHPTVDYIACNYRTGYCTVVYKDLSTAELNIGVDYYNWQYGVSVDDEGETVVIGDWYYNVGLRCYKIATGELIWKKKLSKVQNNVMIGNSVIIARAGTSVMKINRFTGETEKELKSGTIQFIYLLQDDKLFVESLRGKYCIIDGKTLDLLKEFSKNEINPNQCYSLAILEVKEENDEIIIYGWEQYPNMMHDVNNQEIAYFTRRIKL